MAGSAPLKLRFDSFDLDEGNVRLTRHQQPVELTPKAFAVLCELLRKRGDLVTKDALLDAVWGHKHISESVLKTIVSQLRAALADDPRNPRYIETVSRFGYRFIGKATDLVSKRPTNKAATTGDGATNFVGRRDALATLHSCWQRTLDGERQLVWVVGDAGIGKTTLIESFVRELSPETVVFGRCVEHFGAGEPFLPLLEALNEHCRREPELVAVMRSVAPAWLVQMPWLLSDEDRASLHRELAGTHPDRMVRELAELMNRYGSSKPLLLIIEDLHWSDLGTLRMMEHFARKDRSFRFMWLASFRLTQVITEDHPLKELRQELKLHRLCEEIRLDPFSEAEVENYIRRRLPGREMSEDFVRRLHAHTDGLPLFVANATDTLLASSDSGILDEKRWLDEGSSLPLPESLAGVLEKQIARLPVDVRLLLEAASVLGTDFRASFVAEMLDKDVQWVRDECDGLVRCQLWLQHTAMVDLPDGELDSRYSFLHALYKHVFYQRIPAPRRVQHHRRAARLLERVREEGQVVAPAELALHYKRGREIVAALHAYADGARTALSRFAPKDAAKLSTQALALVEQCADPRERMELELKLAAHGGIAASHLYGIASNEARDAFARVQSLCDALPQDPERAVTLNGLGWIHFTRAEYKQSLTLAQRLLDIAAAHDDLALFVYGCNLRGVTLIWQGELVAACESLQQGLHRCLEGTGKLPLESFVIDPEVSMRANIALPLADRGLIDDAKAQMTLARKRAGEIGQPIARMLVHWVSAQIALREEQPDSVALQAEALAEVVQKSMLAQGEGPSLWMRGWAEARLGKPEEGYRLIMEGYRCHTRLGMYAGCTEVLAYATEALILASDWEAATRQLGEAFDLAERIGETLALPQLRLHRARILAARGDANRAGTCIRNAISVAQAQQAKAIEAKARSELASLEHRGASLKTETRP